MEEISYKMIPEFIIAVLIGCGFTFLIIFLYDKYKFKKLRRDYNAEEDKSRRGVITKEGLTRDDFGRAKTTDKPELCFERADESKRRKLLPDVPVVSNRESNEPDIPKPSEPSPVVTGLDNSSSKPESKRREGGNKIGWIQEMRIKMKKEKAEKKLKKLQKKLKIEQETQNMNDQEASSSTSG